VVSGAGGDALGGDGGRPRPPDAPDDAARRGAGALVLAATSPAALRRQRHPGERLHLEGV